MDEITIDMANPDESGEAMENPLPMPMPVGNEGQQREKEIWRADIQKKIRYQACLSADQSTPEYYHRRFDPFNNPDFPSIFKFPGRTDATVAAIGPYHRSVPEHQLIITNAKKSRIVNFLVDHQGLNIDQFLRWVLDEEERARRSYERGSLENIPDSKDFAEMLLLDGCLVIFAIFLLRSSVRIDKKASKMAQDGIKIGEKEFIHLSADISFHMKRLRLELLMLDNQIPFSVIVQLYNQLQTSLFDGVIGKIEEIAVSCFDDIHPICNYDMKHRSFPKTVHHLLHLFHWSRSPSDNKYHVETTDFIKEPKSHLPSAAELRESAILFRKKPPGSSLDLSFHRNMFGMYGEIRIPPLYLSDHSELIFRNLIAFEQSHLICGISVTAFCICMARLLPSETDAKLLRKNGILAHTNKTDQEIVDFFKKLSGEYKETFMPKDLLSLYKDVATHHGSKPGRITGESMVQFFPSPLIAIYVIVGAIIVLATLADKIHSVYRYYHPRH